MRIIGLLTCFALSAAALGSSSTTSLAQSDRWSGFNVGVGIGGSWGDSQAIIDYARVAGNNNINGGTDQVIVGGDDSSAFGSFRVGYDRLISGSFLVGVFGEIDFGRHVSKNFSDNTLALNPNANPPNTFGTSGSVSLDDSINVGGRFGFLVNPQLLLYAAGGYSRIDVEGSATMLNAAGGTVLSLAFDDHLHGYFVGGGAEFEISKGLTLSFDYRYSAYSSDDYSTSNAAVTRTIAANVDPELHSVRLGLNMKLGQQ